VTYGLMLIAYMVVLTHLAGKGGGSEPGASAGVAMRGIA
jgi:hypothetical protein